MYYLDRQAHPLMPPTATGLVLGWKIESGMRYRNVLLVADYNKVRLGKFTARSIPDTPEKEAFFPELLEFPFAQARQFAISNMLKSSALPDLTPPPPLQLPFGPIGESVSDIAPVHIPLPLHLPRFKITQERMCRSGATEGCSACENLTTGRTDACRKCFYEELLAAAGELPPLETVVKPVPEAPGDFLQSLRDSAAAEHIAPEVLPDDSEFSVDKLMEILQMSVILLQQCLFLLLKLLRPSNVIVAYSIVVSAFQHPATTMLILFFLIQMTKNPLSPDMVPLPKLNAPRRNFPKGLAVAYRRIFLQAVLQQAGLGCWR